MDWLWIYFSCGLHEQIPHKISTSSNVKTIFEEAYWRYHKSQKIESFEVESFEVESFEVVIKFENNLDSNNIFAYKKLKGPVIVNYWDHNEKFISPP